MNPSTMNSLEAIGLLVILGLGLVGTVYTFIKVIASKWRGSQKGKELSGAVRNALLMRNPRVTVNAASSNGGCDPCKEPFGSSGVEKYKSLEVPKDFFCVKRRDAK